MLKLLRQSNPQIPNVYQQASKEVRGSRGPEGVGRLVDASVAEEGWRHGRLVAWPPRLRQFTSSQQNGSDNKASPPRTGVLRIVGLRWDD